MPIGGTRAVFLLTALLLSAAFILGGGTRTGLWSDAAVQLVAIALLAVLILQSPSAHCPIGSWPATIVAAAVAIPLLQLVPLPPTAWTFLPGRAPIALPFYQAGIPLPWLPISLDPGATWRAALSLLPAIAVFLATPGFDSAERRRLSLLVIGFAIVSVLLGLAQLMQGHESALRLYPATNVDDSVGFFANRNHYAALLSATIPLVAVWLGEFARSSRRYTGVTISALVLTALILGLGMARSRAGLALGGLATLTSLLLIMDRGHRPARRNLAVLGGALALGFVVVIHFAGYRLVDRLGVDLLADLRFSIFETTARAAWTYFPVGSGFGTFEAIYRIIEPLDALQPRYVNHAHNDWLELLLEGGLPAIILLGTLLAWFGKVALKVWRNPPKNGADDGTLARAATIMIALLLLHSLVDYPLRTTAMTVLFAWSAALLLPPTKITPISADNRTSADQRTPRRQTRAAGLPRSRFFC